MDVPEIHYTRSGDVAIAYQVVGERPLELVFVPTFAILVFPWLNRDWKSFYERLASFARLIMLDKRGTGLSDRPRDLGTLETRMDDIRAVLDAVGAERALHLFHPAALAGAVRRFARLDGASSAPFMGTPLLRAP